MTRGAQPVEIVEPTRERSAPAEHFYPSAFSARAHAVLESFLELDHEAVADLYRTRHPHVRGPALVSLLRGRSDVLAWAGGDLMRMVDEDGAASMCVIEVNSCPSGQKAAPVGGLRDPYRGYRRLADAAVLPRLPIEGEGHLAVLYDKNLVEASGYATVIARQTGEPVLLIDCSAEDRAEHVAFDGGLLVVRGADHRWRPVRGAFRYVTQRPWRLLPIAAKTPIVNPIEGCLAGGRNKWAAADAYERFNDGQRAAGLTIFTPGTHAGLRIDQIAGQVAARGGRAVVKSPYGNCGRGVHFLTGGQQLEPASFEFDGYDRVVVQELVLPDTIAPQRGMRRQCTVAADDERRFVADLRMLIASGPNGFVPVSAYMRRAVEPAPVSVGPMPTRSFGTNLSGWTSSGWSTDAGRLLLLDRATVPRLGLDLVDLVDAFMQTVLAVVAIDEHAVRIGLALGAQQLGTFAAAFPDAPLLREIGETAMPRVQRGHGREPLPATA